MRRRILVMLAVYFPSGMSESALQRYDLLQPIAAGGMGQVFLGQVRGEHGFHKRVAIKRILPELARDPEFVVRFVAEAKLAVSLSHANVVQVFDLGRSGDELLLVMEYVDGTDLGQLLQAVSAAGERIPVPVAVHLALEALKALAYAHERPEGGVIHCDVSPSNLLVSYAGEVKITDFGVAQALEAARRRKSGGAVVGKVRYMAPEQLRGEALDVRTDLYALGVVLYEALAGVRPFAAATPEGIAEAVLAGRAAPLSEMRPEVPAALRAWVARAMSRVPADRPASARKMLAELTQIARELEPVTAPEVGTWARGRVGPRVAGSGQGGAGFDAAVKQILGEPARTGTMSAPVGTMTFVVKTSVGGVTQLERVGGPRKRRGVVMAAVGIVAVAAAGGMAVRWMQVPVRVEEKAPVVVPAVKGEREGQGQGEGSFQGAEKSAAAREIRPRARPKVSVPVADPGFVNVFAEPWAHVFVDGKRIGTTPLAKVALAPGGHRVRLESPRGKATERMIHVVAGQTQLLDVDLE
ncbi:MAG TPA: serine/threonine-protein kinase [Kofleriaceae bacterium]|nr:serine/threonine-protein kinase [Kofleriaceae bacterium]